MRKSVAVIGAGPGGYAAAFRAADLGLDVTLVDSAPQPGGVCLHRGCIPSKALLHAARVIHEAEEASEFGIDFGTPKLNLDALRRWKQRVVDELAAGVAGLARKRKVDLKHARARFVSSGRLELESPYGGTEQMEFDHVIVATGSRPAMPDEFRVGDDRVVDSTGSLELRKVPERLLVVGGGYIGSELATVYAALGSKVHIVELSDSLLQGVDADLVRLLRRRLDALTDGIYLGTRVSRLEPKEAGVLARLDGPAVEPEQLFDAVLVAVGRAPNSGGLGLEKTRVQVDDRGFIRVDRRMRTHDEHVLAIGDVAGPPLLAHKATRQGKVAAEVLAGEAAEFDNLAIPSVVFTDPEIAWCGLTETEARQRDATVRVLRFPWSASGRARTLGRTDGLTKLLVEDGSQRVLGMGVVGAGAGELIAEGVLAVETGALARDVAESIHAHPTLSETVAEAAEQLLGGATHLVPGASRR